MADINLLPWREVKKAKQNKQFRQQLWLILLLAVLMTMLVRQFYQYQLGQQQKTNQQYQQKIQALSPKLTELNQINANIKGLNSRLQFVEQLTLQQQNNVAIWQTLAKAKPANLYFTQIKKEGNQVILFGRASNANQVALLSDTLSSSQWFANTMVRNINQDLNNRHLVAFEIACQFDVGVDSVGDLSTNSTNMQESP